MIQQLHKYYPEIAPPTVPPPPRHRIVQKHKLMLTQVKKIKQIQENISEFNEPLK